MKIFNVFKDMFGQNSSVEVPEMDINPANGLPMLGDTGIDIHGNAFGTDINDICGGIDFDVDTGCGTDFDC